MKTEEITVVPIEEAMEELRLRAEKAGGVSALSLETKVSHTLIGQALKGTVQAGPKVLEIVGLRAVRVLQKIETQGK